MEIPSVVSETESTSLKSKAYVCVSGKVNLSITMFFCLLSCSLCI